MATVDKGWGEKEQSRALKNLLDGQVGTHLMKKWSVDPSGRGTCSLWSAFIEKEVRAALVLRVPPRLVVKD